MVNGASEFDEGSAVTARVGEPGVYDAALGEGWRIGGGVNGGVLLAIAGARPRDASSARRTATVPPIRTRWRSAPTT